MLKNVHEEWEKASSDARGAAEGEPAKGQEILSRMDAVSSALKKISQGTVSKATLSQAVKNALVEIIREDPGFLGIDGIRQEVEALRAQQAAKSQEFRGNVEKLIKTVARRMEEELGKLRSHLDTEVENLGSQIRDGIGGARSAMPDGPDALLSAVGNTAGAAFDVRLEDQAGKLLALGKELTSADENLAEGLKDLESRLTGKMEAFEASAAARIGGLESDLLHSLAAAETRLTESQGGLETALGGRVEGLDGELRRELAAAEGRLAEAQARIEENLGREVRELATKIPADLALRLAKIEETIPELRAIEDRLRKQMEIAMDQVAEKLNGLTEIVVQIQSALPDRGVFDSLSERLDRCETRFRTVSDQLDGLEGAVPELKSLGERITALRSDLSTLSSEVTSSGKEFQDVWSILSHRVQEVQDLLRGTVDRWNADRSNLRQRLVDLRDTVHDQLQVAIKSADGTPATFWGKVLGKSDGGLQLGIEDWERLRLRLETVIQGLEGLLSEIK
jgi:archaellum component FlaC